MTSVKKSEVDGVIVLTIDRPPVNALDIATLDELSDHLDDLGDPDALILTGAGSIFSAGADLQRILDADPADIDEGIVALARAFRTLFTFPRPVVAAVNGHALAGGCVLAACCDHRIMSEEGTIGAVELAAGVPFPAWALEPLRFAVHNHHLQEIALFGRAYGSEQALAMGLVDEISAADQLVDRSLQRAHRLARVPRLTFASTKAMLRAPAVAAADQSGAETDADIKAAWRSPGVLQAVRDTMEALKGNRT